MINFVNFSTENHLFSLLFRVRIEPHVPLKSPITYFIKSLFRSFAVEVIFWTTENREVPSASNFGVQVKPSDKSLISIRKNNGPRIDPWGTPAWTLVQDECCPFKTTLCFLWYGKSVITFKRLPDIPWYTVLLQLEEKNLVPNLIKCLWYIKKDGSSLKAIIKWLINIMTDAWVSWFEPWLILRD